MRDVDAPAPRSTCARACSGLLLLHVLLLPLSLGRQATAEGREKYEWALERYEKWVTRVTLRKRTIARERLAQTGDARALQVLVRDYEKPEEPKDHVRYLIATMCGKWLGGEEAWVPQWTAWRKKNAQPAHAWLWYQTAQVEARHRGTDAVDALAAAGEQPLLRAATLRSLADFFYETPSAPKVAEAARALAASLPKTPAARGALVEALALALVTLRLPWDTPEAAALGNAVIDGLADPLVPARSKLVVARALGRAFGSEAVESNPEIWRRELAAAQAGAPSKGAEPDRYAGPSFAGLRAAGSRIAYVIDLSDSMLIPLNAAEKEALQRPTTPKDGAPAAPRPVDDLPWDKIVTRFDAARECLKLSLSRLGKDQHFCVAVFGTKSALLESTPHLKQATPASIKATIHELDQLASTISPPTAASPNGVLRGATNLHGGLRKAFLVSGRSLVDDNEHIEPRLFEDGCDTIFLLSDGVPSWDDFEGTEAPDVDDRAGNPETGVLAPNTPTLTFDGPYGQLHATADYLVQDVRRMNLLRNVEIHVVAVGEADDRLLKRIADLGLGKLRRIGAPAAPRK